MMFVESARLTRFYSLFESVLEFLESKDLDLKENQNKLIEISHIKKNIGINLQLHGDSLNLIKTMGVISFFFSAKLK